MTRNCVYYFINRSTVLAPADAEKMPSCVHFIQIPNDSYEELYSSKIIFGKT